MSKDEDNKIVNNSISDDSSDDFKTIKLTKSNDASMEEYAAKEMDKIRSDLEFYEIVKMLGTKEQPITRKIVQDNLAKLIDLHEDFLYCKSCPGINNCKKVTPHMKLRLNFDGKAFKRYFDPCDKFLDSIEQTTKYTYADFPDEWRNNSTKNIDMDSDRKIATMRLLSMMSDGSVWIYLYGIPGVGKSFVASALSNDYIAQKDNSQVAFINALNRFKELQDYSFNDKEKFSRELLNLSSVALLVIDGFGNEYKSDYVRDVILLPILSERLRKKLPVIFTSNFTIKEIASMYSTSKAGYVRSKQLETILKTYCKEEINLVSQLY